MTAVHYLNTSHVLYGVWPKVNTIIRKQFAFCDAAEPTEKKVTDSFHLVAEDTEVSIEK